MKYFVLKDTGEFIKSQKGILKVYRNNKWERDFELLGVFSGDVPIRNVTKEEYDRIVKGDI